LAKGQPTANGGQQPSRVEDLRDLSIDQLAQVQVTSVSKSPEALSDAPAAIYVITHDDIIRSGAISLPEILRLAPNLDVVETAPATTSSPPADSAATSPTKTSPTSSWC
jgi:outer membrane cobalamin receptor